VRSLAGLALGIGLLLGGCGSSGGGLPGGGPEGLLEDPDPTPEPTPQPSFDLCINEFMSENDHGITDASGEFADWIELHNPTATAVPLAGWTLSDDLEEWDQHVFGDELQIEAGGFLVLWADGDVEEGVQHLPFGLSRDGGSMVLADPYGSSSTVHFGPLGSDHAAARATDCCDGGGCWVDLGSGSPGWSNEIGGTNEVVLLDRGSPWRYLDSGVDPGGSWTGAGFDDSGWDEGFAPLGYGDFHIATSIDSGHTTSWFRATFDATGTEGFDRLALRLLRDAGAAVYINGVEAARANLPEGSLSSSTHALRNVGGQEEILYFHFEADAAQLVAGANQAAVEVHRASGAGGSDLGFDLEILSR
jgi:hypothetical protein